MKNIAILSTAPSIDNDSYNVAQFDTALKSRLSSKLNIDTILFSDLIVTISPKEFSIVVATNNKDLREYDFVFFKSWIRLAELAHVIADYLQLNTIAFQPKELQYHHSCGKLSESVYFYKEKYLFPDTTYTINPWLLKQEYSKSQLAKVIVKGADAFGGQDNHLVDTTKKLDDIIGNKKEINYVMQPFIPNKFDYRIFIVGNETPLIIKRTRIGSSHLNNTSKGAHAELCDPHEIDSAILRKSIQLAKKMNRSFAGVDVMFGDDKKYYFLEINKSPQVASGAFVEEKIDVFASGVAGMVEELTEGEWHE